MYHLQIICFFINLYAVFCIENNFRFANHYGSNMVLQRAPLQAVLWGFGEENQIVKMNVNISERIYETLVAKDFRGNNTWKIELPPMRHTGPVTVKATSIWKNRNVSAILKNVLFGDVWICSGQSNMGFTVSMSSTREEEVAMAKNHSLVRIFTPARHFSVEPVIDLDYENVLQNWTIASPESIDGPAWRYFSAVCWMYGRRLYDLYQVPIGLIATYWGGTCAEAWSSPDALQECGLTSNERPNVYEDDETEKTFQVNRKKEDFNVKSDRNSINKLTEQGNDLPLHNFIRAEKNRKMKFRSASIDQNSYSVLWNAMIFPFLNTTIKGVIWYQGEHNNVINPNLYACVFPEMINDWRRKWNEGTRGNTDPNFPFGFVQLAPIANDVLKIRPFFPKIRWEQTANYGYVPNPKQQNVFMAVAMDLPDDRSPYGSIHPRDKASVADRLVLGARAIVYGEKDVIFQGPIMDSCDVIEHDRSPVARVVFRGTDEHGIGVRSPHGFEVHIAGVLHWTPVEIIFPTEDKKGVLLSIPTGNITTIRYAWTHRPCNYKQCAIYSFTNDLPSPPGICNLSV